MAGSAAQEKGLPYLYPHISELRHRLCRPAGALRLSLTLPTAYARGLNNFAPSGLVARSLDD